MRKRILLIAVASFAIPALLAQHDHGHGEHAAMQMESTPVPPVQRAADDHHEIDDPQPSLQPEDAQYYPYGMPMMDPGPFGLLLIDQLEYRAHDGEDLVAWEVEGWYGGDVNRLWIKSRGESSVASSSSGNGELHAYYGRLVAPFWDLQAGLRFDETWGSGSESRLLGAFGFQGRVPYNYEVTSTLFLSDEGDVSARLSAAKDLRITQRLVAEAEFETEVAANAVPEFGVGTGFNYVEVGLRLRYEIRREFAPYIGLSWERKLGNTADLAKEEGEAIDQLSAVAGIRFWF